MQHEELYDLEYDAIEKNNLVNNPKYAATLSELRDHCNSLIKNVEKE